VRSWSRGSGSSATPTATSSTCTGPGVVGEQPTLDPGSVFEYTSYCPLKTAVGTMHGTYQMVTPDGEQFDAVIAPFTLATPHSLN
jgi:ApaG protein